MPYEIDASEWLNTPEPLMLSALRGRVVVVTVFQMLCRGCATISLPQASKLDSAFSREDLMVVGLHSVFEHHHVMTPDALRAFIHEYRLGFPIAIDRPSDGLSIPSTMRSWSLDGTPTLMVFGRNGELALKHFGHIEDLQLGAVLGSLISAGAHPPADTTRKDTGAGAGPVCNVG